MSATVRKFEFDTQTRAWKAVRVPKGKRKEEWNNENRKIGRSIRRRQKDYDLMVTNPKFKGNTAGYHRPGSAS